MSETPVRQKEANLFPELSEGMRLLEERLPIHEVAARVENAYDDPRFEPEVDKKLGYTTRRLLCLPIRNEAGAIIGVLHLLNKAEPFNDADEAFLDALSAHVALAREIQAGILPEAPPAWEGVEIAGSHRASQMVGGDYYDFLPVKAGGKEALLIVVADVEGKGAASALVMANVQAMLHALADRVDALEKLPATINQNVLMGARGYA